MALCSLSARWVPPLGRLNRCLVTLVLLAGLIQDQHSRGGQLPPEERPGAAGVSFIELSEHGRAALSAASMVVVKDGLAALVLFQHAQYNGAWVAAAAPQSRRVLDPELIDKDRFIGIEDGRLRPSFRDNPDEYRSYLYVIGYAHDVPPEAMAKAVNSEITYTHLLEHPARYRGSVVRVTGKLRQLRKWDAPSTLWNDGIRDFYEGVIESDTHFAHRYYVVLTEVPQGIKPGDRLDYPVTCHAFFFKRAYLEAKDGTRRAAPLLVGRGLTLHKLQAAELDPESWKDSPGLLVFGAFVALAGLIGGLIVWFRQGDRLVRSRLALARPAEWRPPTESSNGTTAEQPTSAPDTSVSSSPEPPSR